MIKTIIFSNLTFGYKSVLKDEWKKGKLPSVIYGFYGDELKEDNLSVEHLEPKSKGGESKLSNYVLASKQKNSLRGNQPLEQFANEETIAKHLIQYINVKTSKINGNAYIELILKKLKRFRLDWKKIKSLIDAAR